MHDDRAVFCECYSLFFFLDEQSIYDFFGSGYDFLRQAMAT